MSTPTIVMSGCAACSWLIALLQAVLYATDAALKIGLLLGVASGIDPSGATSSHRKYFAPAAISVLMFPWMFATAAVAWLLAEDALFRISLLPPQKTYNALDGGLGCWAM